MTLTKKQPPIKYIAIAIGLVAIVSFGLLAAQHSPVQGPDLRHFASSRWKKNADFDRERATSDLLVKKILDGKSRSQVKELLGPPDNSDGDAVWGYDVPPSTASFESFLVHFENDKVKSCEVHANP